MDGRHILCFIMLATGCATTKGTRSSGKLTLPDTSGELKVEALQLGNSPASRPVRSGSIWDGRAVLSYAPKVVAKVDGRRHVLPDRWQRLLAGWKPMTTLLGKREVCPIGGVVDGRSVDGGVCFDERSRRWRAVTGKASGKGLVHDVAHGCRFCATCSFLAHSERGVIFECASQVDRGHVAGHRGKVRWEYYHRLVSGIR